MSGRLEPDGGYVNRAQVPRMSETQCVPVVHGALSPIEIKAPTFPIYGPSHFFNAQMLYS